MPGTTVGPTLRGITKKVLDARISIEEQDGAYTLGPLNDPYLRGDPKLIEKLQSFLSDLVKNLNEK